MKTIFKIIILNWRKNIHSIILIQKCELNEKLLYSCLEFIIFKGYFKLRQIYILIKY